MATTKGPWKLQEVRDQILNSDWVTYNILYDSGAVAASLWSFGNNSSGQLGTNNTVSYSSPVQIPGTLWACVSDSNSRSSLAIKTDGSLWVWGGSICGSLGTGIGNTHYSSPVQIPGVWCSVASGLAHSLAIKADGTLWTWGCNSRGQLGNSTDSTIDVSSPIQIPGTSWCSVYSQEESVFALKNNGTLWAWGYGQSGRLGICNTISISSPVQIPGTAWCSLSAGCFMSIALKTDNTMWVWGLSSFLGNIGNNATANNQSSPIQIPGTSWCYVNSGGFNGAAIKTNSTLWVWGDNYAGQLGQNNLVHYSSPVQLPGAWCKVFTVGNSTLAIKNDSTLWAMGCNIEGNGRGGRGSWSSPVQIPGTQWYDVSRKYNNGLESVLARKT